MSKFKVGLVGLGSITNVQQFKEVIDLQFDFFVSPGIIEEIINLNANVRCEKCRINNYRNQIVSR